MRAQWLLRKGIDMRGLATMTHTSSSPLVPSIAPLRLLIPVDATPESMWAVSYALRRAQEGNAVEACLLYVAEPVRSWEVLKFRTEQEVRQHFQQRSAIFLHDAALPLEAAGVAHKEYFREANAVFGILDMAEELDCSEIVLPMPGWRVLYPNALGYRLQRAARNIPVTLVRAEGVRAT